MAINAQELQGQWNNLRGQVKSKWGQLTDDDLQIHGGNIDQLVGKIQQKTGEGRESIEKFLGDLTSKGSSGVASATEAVGNFAQQAGDRLRDQYGNLASQARDQYGNLINQAREGVDQAQDLVRQNPGQSVAAAFGVGLVVGVVVGLALRSR
ncbi:MAG: CsbD family protein [Planctomycetia bacterium]|nr:CsbD family protein [Planctomycetia bacterium]